MMNKLIAALIGGAFAFGSVAAMAQIGSTGDKTLPQPVDTAKLKAQRDAAMAEYASMTPAEKAAYKKGVNAGRQKLLGEQQLKAMDQPRETAADAAAVKADKAQPKALPTPAAKQKALEQQEKEAGHGS